MVFLLAGFLSKHKSY